LANVAPSQFASKYEGRLPTTLSGADFLEVYGPHLDSVTRIDPSQLYSIRTPTAHPVYENFRVQTFRQVLAARHTSAHQQLEVLGELMLQSHESYTRCQLGSEGTNLLV